MNSGLCLNETPSLRKSLPISYTRSSPPTISRFKYSSVAIRRYSVRSSSLWCVVNGRPAPPPYSGCRTGVSTSMNPSASRNRRISLMTRARVMNTSRESSFAIRSSSRIR